VKKFFCEREFLVKALVAIFAIQFGYVGYQAFTCRSVLLREAKGSEIPQFCVDASRNFLEVGKLAIPTILALLVKSSEENDKGNNGTSNPKTAVRSRTREEENV
jgi:hypothetical protein